MKIDEFGWWHLERISSYAGTQFTSTEFQDKYQTRIVHLTLAAPEHQETNEKVEVTQRTLCMIAHSLMVHARVSEPYIHLALMYTADHIFPVLPRKDLINEDGEPTTPYKLEPYKLATGIKPSISHLCVLFFPCVVQKSTTHVRTELLNMRHQANFFLRYLHWS